MGSVEERIDDVRRFVCDVKPGLHYNIVPIVDVYGPAGSDKNLECIVVSQETVRGAHAINSRRAEQVCYLYYIV
jgi:phosphopantetheine adenylyltransferase